MGTRSECMSERTPEQIGELLKKGHRVRKPPEEEIEELEQRIAELEDRLELCGYDDSGQRCVFPLDGIACRDTTISGLKQRVSELLRCNHELRVFGDRLATNIRDSVAVYPEKWNLPAVEQALKKWKSAVTDSLAPPKDCA